MQTSSLALQGHGEYCGQWRAGLYELVQSLEDMIMYDLYLLKDAC